jgi:hypothetical protein
VHVERLAAETVHDLEARELRRHQQAALLRGQDGLQSVGELFLDVGLGLQLGLGGIGANQYVNPRICLDDTDL